MLVGIHHIPAGTGGDVANKSDRSLYRDDPDIPRDFANDNDDDDNNTKEPFFYGLLEDEDDCSYLEGAERYDELAARKLRACQQHPDYEEVEMKKEQTIEQIYWPFHRFYDINGHRRMKPKKSHGSHQHPCDDCEGGSELAKTWNIPEFDPPLSDRKDGGLMMDSSHVSHPMVFRGKQGDTMEYEGKIYYMGIIDILQHYNARKQVETRYRKVGGLRQKAEPSCVSPDDYASRFIQFFDEYSQKTRPSRDGKSDEPTESTACIGNKNESSLETTR